MNDDTQPTSVEEENTESTNVDLSNSWIPFVVISSVASFALLVFLLQSLRYAAMCIPLLALGVFGFTLVRSALVYRRTGWISGLAMGLGMLLLGVGGILGFLYSALIPNR